MAAKVTDKDMGFRRMFKKFQTGKPFEVFAGVIGPKATKAKNTPGGEKSDLNVAQVASVLEFGTSPGAKPSIPERPFLRAPFDKNQKKYNRIVTKSGKKTDDGLTGVEAGLFLAAEAYVGDVISAINNDEYKKLSEVTIERRRKNDPLPLINTGQMIGSIGTRIKNRSKYRKG